MKLVYFDDFKLGVLKGDTVVDVSAEVQGHPACRPGRSDERADRALGQLQAAARGGGRRKAQACRCQACASVRRCRGRAHIDCMAVNYMEDGERSAPAPINAFHKSPSAIIGHGDTMVLPDVPAMVFEGEAEMAAVIGKKCSHVSEADAMSYMFGYMNFIDGSARGLPPPGNVFFQMKSRDTFRADRPLYRHRRRDQGPAETADQAVEQRRADAELQYRRYGPQDRQMHRLAVEHPYAAARRHRRHRHQSPRPQPVHGRRHDRAGNRRARPVEIQHQGRV